MSKIFVGNITSEAEKLLNKYLDKFIPDAVIEPLKAAGIRGKIKNHAKRSEVIIVILDETLFDMCKGVADDVLSLPKVHKYVSDEGLKEFLEKKFGVLDSCNEEVEEVVDEFESLTVTDAEDTSNLKDKDSIIQKLNDDIIIKDTMIRNLEAQIEEKSSSDNVSHFIARIKSLESELEIVKSELSKVQNDSYADLGKVTRAEQIIDSIDKLKEELSIEKSRCIKLEEEKLALEAEIGSKNNELTQCINDLNTKSKSYNDLDLKMKELTSSLDSLKSSYDDKVKELSEVKSERFDLESKVKQLSSQVAEIAVLNDKIDSLNKTNTSLSDKVSSLSGLKVDLENLRIDYDKVVSKKNDLEFKVSDLKSKLDEATLKVEGLESNNGVLDAEIKKLTLSNNELSAQIKEISSKLSDKDTEIDSLRSQLEKSNEVFAELDEARDKISELNIQLKQFEDTKKSLDDKISEVEDLRSRLDSKNSIENDLSIKDSEIEKLKLDLSIKVEELESVKNERNTQRDSLDAKDSKITSLDRKVQDLINEIDELKSGNSELDSTNKKLVNEINDLREKSSNSDSLLKNSAELENELTECKRAVARLETENNSLKVDLKKVRGTTDKDIEISNLRLEISNYKSKIRILEDSSNEQSKSVSDEVVSLRERCASLEVSLLEKDNELKSVEGNVFSKMSVIASPKTVFNLTLDVPSDLDNMYVFASGSYESNISTYQVLRRICASTNKSVLILDLVTDSYIDRELGVEKILSPIEFLQGNKPLKDFVSKAKVGNTYVSSTAFSYLNSLYLLNVDWQYVLSNLQGLADIVIINVGCLNEIVSKVLFNAFSSVMQPHIVIKASPINLRTALLTLTGIPSAKKSKISCVSFENSSKAMYQRLAQKFNTQILKDSDVLRL